MSNCRAFILFLGILWNLNALAATRCLTGVPHYNQEWFIGNGDCMPNSATQVLGYHDNNGWPRLVPEGCNQWEHNPQGVTTTMDVMKDAMDWWKHPGYVPSHGFWYDALGTTVAAAAKRLDPGASFWTDDDDWTSWDEM